MSVSIASRRCKYRSSQETSRTIAKKFLRAILDRFLPIISTLKLFRKIAEVVERLKAYEERNRFLFTYNKQFHNVMAVSKSGYKNCDATKPIATWSTGKDSVVLNTTGHHYFICGFPGHCGIGQKVDIRVASASPSAAPSEAPSTAPAPASGSEPAGGASSGRAGAAPSPHGNAASTVGCSVALALAVSVLSAAGLNLL